MKKKPRTGFVNFFILILFCAALFLGFKINEKKKWIELPAVGSWLPYENWFKVGEKSVSSIQSLHHLIDDYYTTGGNVAVSLYDGIVLKSDENSLSILHDNGLKVVYSHLEDVIVKTDERILKGANLASYKDSLHLQFYKDDKKLTYEEVLKL